MKRSAFVLPAALLLLACPADDVGDDEIGDTVGQTEDTTDDTSGESSSEGMTEDSTDSTTTDTTDSTTTDSTTTDSTTTDSTTDDTTDTGDPACGDGLVDDGEECDEGEANADDAACTSACTVAVCGDGLVYAEVEGCDGSGESADCNADCTVSACGDGTLNVSAGEVCDTVVEGLTCVDEGFDGGEIACNADSCEVDTGLCVSAFEATFTNCAKTGETGPSQDLCDTDYTGTSLEGLVTVDAGVQAWTVPFTGVYAIEVWGAQGGNHTKGPGGEGARMKGDFDLQAGQVLHILVGQKGSDGTSYDVGGGGGSFVALDDDTPLIVAGGGGGAGNCGNGWVLAELIGKSLLGDGNGGVGGNDGTWCGCGGDGSPGGGFSTGGSPTGGAAFIDGGMGDNTERPSQCVDSGLGGFGGGGNGGNGGGGGGGYQGGDAGGSQATAVGQGGSSYNDGANPEGEDGVQLSHGAVTITLAL